MSATFRLTRTRRLNLTFLVAILIDLETAGRNLLESVTAITSDRVT